MNQSMGHRAPHSNQRIAFLFDDRLSHDRKVIFARTVTILKAHFNIDILPVNITEDEVISQIEQSKYSVVLVPWYKYIAWKKLERHFGALRLQGSTVAGYFAEAVLPMDLSGIPSFHRFLFLDFYRFDQVEMEMILSILVQPELASGFTGLSVKNGALYHADWFDSDQDSTSCVDQILKIPLIANGTWANRAAPLRFFLTALWSLCFQSRRSFPSAEAVAQIEITEVKKRLFVKMVFEKNDLTLKQTIDHIWPNGEHQNYALNEMVKYADFLRIHHFPESHQIEVTAMFSPSSPALSHPGEVRGFWIEPLKKRFLTETDQAEFKRIAIASVRTGDMANDLQSMIDEMRNLVLAVSTAPPENRTNLSHQISNLRFLLDELEKRMPASRSEKSAEKKKIA